VNFVSKIAIMLLGLLLSSTAASESLFSSNSQLYHLGEHTLASGTIYEGVYLTMHDGLKATKLQSFCFGALTSLAAGFAYKDMEQMQQSTPVNFGRSMTYNVIGVALPALLNIRVNF
jgi:hypothetical protein